MDAVIHNLRYWAGVLRWPREDPWELVNEAWAVMQRAPCYAIGNVKWPSTCARFAVLRARKRIPRLCLDRRLDGAELLTEEHPFLETLDLLIHMSQGLREEDFRLIRLRYRDGMPLREIATLLGVTRMTVSLRLKSLHARMRSTHTGDIK